MDLATMTENAEGAVADILTRAYESAIAADRGYVVLIGDLMLDIWLEGQVDRQSPEDPDVPVFLCRHTAQVASLGAAGLVYSHLKSMGLPAVKFISMAGNDPAFVRVTELLLHLKQAHDGFYVAVWGNSSTTTKLRAFDQHQKQKIRIDTEDICPISGDGEDTVLTALRDCIGPQCRLVVVSDYNKGLITSTVMAAIRDLCGRRNVPFMVDPARRPPGLYLGAHVISPNVDEFLHMLGRLGSPAKLGVWAPEWSEFQAFHEFDIKHVCLTRGMDGIALSTYDPPHWQPFPTWPVHRVDAIGAGDAVTAGLALMLSGADPAPMEIAVQFANVLAGWSVAQRRTASPRPETIRALIEESAGWITMPAG